MPVTRDLGSKGSHRSDVRWYGIIREVSAYDLAEPSTLYWNRQMLTTPDFGFHLMQLRSHPLCHRVPG